MFSPIYLFFFFCFVFSVVSFAVQRLLGLVGSYLFIVAFVSFALGERDPTTTTKAVIYVKECSACIFFWEFYGFWSYVYIFNPFWVYFCIWYEKMFWFHPFTCVLQFMGLQRVGHDWVTELNWTELYSFPSTTYWRDCSFSILYSFFLCCRLIEHKFMCLFLASPFCSLDLCDCFCAINILFWLWELCSVV